MNRKVKKLYKCVLVKESESIATSCVSILYLYFRSKWKKQGQKSLQKKLYAPPIFLLIFLLNFCLSKKEESPFLLVLHYYYFLAATLLNGSYSTLRWHLEIP